MTHPEPLSAERMVTGATNPTAWAMTQDLLRESTATYWLATVRPDGLPHAVPVLAVWVDGSLFFCAGESTRKARNPDGRHRWRQDPVRPRGARPQPGQDQPPAAGQAATGSVSPATTPSTSHLTPKTNAGATDGHPQLTGLQASRFFRTK
jgi:Pyridoxamine 5'-phosphate oxidase